MSNETQSVTLETPVVPPVTGTPAVSAAPPAQQGVTPSQQPTPQLSADSAAEIRRLNEELTRANARIGELNTESGSRRRELKGLEGTTQALQSRNLTPETFLAHLETLEAQAKEGRALKVRTLGNEAGFNGKALASLAEREGFSLEERTIKEDGKDVNACFATFKDEDGKEQSERLGNFLETHHAMWLPSLQVARQQTPAGATPPPQRVPDQHKNGAATPLRGGMF